jgi:hypothetical protein
MPGMGVFEMLSTLKRPLSQLSTELFTADSTDGETRSGAALRLPGSNSVRRVNATNTPSHCDVRLVKRFSNLKTGHGWKKFMDNT